MPLNDVRQVKNQIMLRKRSIAPHQSNSKFSPRQHLQLNQSSHKNGHFVRQIWLR